VRLLGPAFDLAPTRAVLDPIRAQIARERAEVLAMGLR
jgi:hypothetical protein